MNLLASSINNESTLSLTENGDLTYNTSGNENVDWFFKIGAIRNRSDEDVLKYFKRAFKENPELAIRVALYGRDILEGAGERRVFRLILKHLSINEPVFALALINKIPELGRWDDLFSMIDGNKTVARDALQFYSLALRNGDALAAKWAPRKGLVAARLRGILNETPKGYRKLLVNATNVVESQMCVKQWDKIEYSHVPSIASSRYAKAFTKHDETRYNEYLNRVINKVVNEKTGKVEKINAKAIFPHDVIKAPSNTADAMWQNLPDFVPEDISFFPMIDTSSSMTWTEVSPGVQPLDVGVSLGIYVAERNKSDFKNLLMSFETSPNVIKLNDADSIKEKVHSVKRMGVGGSTNFDAAYKKLLDIAIQCNAPQEDMPKFLLVFSDMEFNSSSGSYTAADRLKIAFEKSGYKIPTIIWWNLQSRGDTTPVKANAEGMVLVSGFSPSIMANVLTGEATPEKMMLNVVMQDRYKFL